MYERNWLGRSSLGKKYKTNREANDKVYETNQQASKYVETLALFCANFERICAEKKEAEEQFDRDFDESVMMLSDSRTRCIRVAETHARIEEDLNEGLRVIRSHFQETASATLALACGKSDRGPQRSHLLAGNLGHGGHFAGQGYARRRLRGGRDWGAGGAMTEE